MLLTLLSLLTILCHKIHNCASFYLMIQEDRPLVSTFHLHTPQIILLLLYLLGIKYVQKKKLFAEKFAEDIGRVWKHYQMHVNVILGWPWLQQMSCTSVCYNNHILERSCGGKRIILEVKLLSMSTQNSAQHSVIVKLRNYEVITYLKYQY